MLRVVDLLALPVFSGFRLVSSGDGIYNEISGVGILEWEAPEDVYETFSRRDFVFTSIFMQEGSREKAHAGIEALLRKGVSAISFKLADKNSSIRDFLPERIIDMADRLKIPLLLYSDTYLEDLIFTVRSSLLAKDSNTIALDCLKQIMAGNEANAVASARNLNPMFYNNLRCFCCIPAGSRYGDAEYTAALDGALEQYRKTFSGHIPDPESHDSVIRCEKCMIIIETSKHPFKAFAGGSTVGEILRKYNINPEGFSVGISSVKKGVNNIRDAVSEAQTTAVHAALDREAFALYEDAGADRLLVPFFNTDVYKDFYQAKLLKLNEYDSSHDSALTETLMAYADSMLDIKLTATKLYQHPNTIRYRLSRIREIMDTDKSPDGLLELLIFSRMHKTISILGEEPLI